MLAVLLIAELLVGLRWIFPDERVTLLVVLAFASMVMLAAGLISDKGASAPPTPRTRVGSVLSWLYCGVIGLCGCGVVFLYGINGLPPTTPSASVILPLPPGLAITGNIDEQCSGGSTLYCTREISIESTTGLTDNAVVEELEARLGAAGWENGCRQQGVLLDRNTQCVQVGVANGRVNVELDDSSGW